MSWLTSATVAFSPSSSTTLFAYDKTWRKGSSITSISLPILAWSWFKKSV